jgi:hypothetical protein
LEKGFFPAETGDISQKTALTTKYAEVYTELFIAIGFWLLAFDNLEPGTQNPEL